MPATTQEQLLSYVLPKVFIEKISLNSDTTNHLKVVINLTIKETLDNDLFGSWFDQINIKKYILLDVVQSIDPKVTDALSFSNDMIQICNFSRNTSTNDAGIKAFSYITKERDYSKLMSMLREKTQRQSFSISKDTNGDNKITNYTSYVDNDGKKVYEIPYKVTFTINNMEPEHLSYFVVSSLDLQSLSRDFKIDYDVLESLEENGRVISEVVIDNSQTVGFSFVYVDKNGNIWDGPVHQSSNTTWMSGDDETPNSIP